MMVASFRFLQCCGVVVVGSLQELLGIQAIVSEASLAAVGDRFWSLAGCSFTDSAWEPWANWMKLCNLKPLGTNAHTL